MVFRGGKLQRMNSTCGVFLKKIMLFVQKFVVFSMMAYTFKQEARNMERGKSWRFTGIYGNPNADRRNETWELMDRRNNVPPFPWVVGGDFNEITRDVEKKGRVDRISGQLDAFRAIVNKCTLIHLGYRGDDFTWTNGHLSCI